MIIKSFALRLIYMGIGLVNIKLFLVYFASSDYGLYAWIISFCALGSVVSFLGTNSELFRRLSSEGKFSSKEYTFCICLIVVVAVLFVFLTTLLTEMNYLYEAMIYLVLFVVSKTLLIFARVKANVILIDFLNTGLFPVCLFFSLLIIPVIELKNIQYLFVTHIVLTMIILLIVSYFIFVNKYFLLIDFSEDTDICKLTKNSLHLWITSISSLSFSVLDIFILGLFVSPSILASYVFVTRVSSVASIPLGFLVSRFQPYIIKFKSGSLDGVLKIKFQCIVFIMLSMCVFYFSEDVIISYFRGVTDLLYLFYLFSSAYIIRSIFFEKVILVQFVLGIKEYAWFSVVNTLFILVLSYFAAKESNILLFAIVVVLGQLTPVIYTIYFRFFGKPVVSCKQKTN